MYLLNFMAVFAQQTAPLDIPTAGLPILEFGTVLTFIIRVMFIVAGLFALFYALIGALDWITSEGDKEKVKAARDKIQAAIVGLFILILVLTIMWILETIVFRRAICFGISCNVKVPSLVRDDSQGCPYATRAQVVKRSGGGTLSLTENSSSGTFGVQDSRSPGPNIFGTSEINGQDALLGDSAEFIYRNDREPFKPDSPRGRYTRGDSTDVRLLGLGSRWRITDVFCRGGKGCPADINSQGVTSTISNFTPDCDVDITYGWIVDGR